MSQDFTVLIVDDDFHVASLHSSYVASVPGFTVAGHAGNAQQALQAFHSLRPDLVLLDVYLPDGSGLDVLRQLDCDVIMLSAAADATSLRMAFRRGALAYLLKPFGPEDLAQRLRSYARYRRLLDRATSLDQEAVERARRALLGGEAAVVAAPARTRSATEQTILEALAGAAGRPEALSALEVARQVGVSRATAQRYLSALADDGAVGIQLRYGTTGRPEHRYARRP
ncbi:MULTISPECIES: response regulator [Arthrobacter]|uniref:Transcriptional regulatory protein n=2 Tax=Arthrobacter TaxID=1663 RepID=A0ABU9KN88_9MICC|nr:response regulator [Arthrobacter sp. YJM1]MDP5228318.1 response regulator [Arthrobacter sp. YJM1]